MENNDIKAAKKIPGWVYITGIVALIAVVAIIVMVISSGRPAKRVAGKLAMADRYMTELKYEEAIALYKEVLEIEPKSIEAYSGLFNAYVAIGDEAEANAVIEKMELLLAEEREDATKQKLSKEIARMREKLGNQAEDEKPGILEEEGGSKNTAETIYKSNGLIDKVQEKNEAGQLVKETIYNYVGDVRYINVYDYDSNGWLVKISSFDPSYNLFDVETYDYDSSVRCVKITYYDGSGRIYEYETIDYDEAGGFTKSSGNGDYYEVYDASGYCIKRVDYERMGYGIESTSVKNFERIHEYENDGSGRHIKETFYYNGPYEAYENYYTFEYDSDGRMLKGAKVFDEDYYSYGSVTYVYDSEGRVIKENDTTYEYDSAGRPIKETADFYGSLTVGEYNDNGDVVKRNYYDDAGNVMFWEAYEYDPKGNMILKEFFAPQTLYDAQSHYIKEYDAAGAVIRMTVFDEDGGYTIRDSFDNYESSYDSNGVLISTTEYSGVEEGDFNYLTSETITYYDRSGNVSSREVWEYRDATDSYKRSTHYNTDGSYVVYDYAEYDSWEYGYHEYKDYKDHLPIIKTTYYNSDGSIRK